MSDKDEHFCIVCKETIHGLMNYVNHRKNGCLDETKTTNTSNENLHVVCQQPAKKQGLGDGISLESNYQSHQVVVSPAEGFQSNNNVATPKTPEQSDSSSTTLKSAIDYNHASMDWQSLPKSSDYMDDSDMEENEADIDVDPSDVFIQPENVNSSVADGVSSDSELNVNTIPPKEYGLLSAEVENEGPTADTEIQHFTKKKKKRKKMKLADMSRLCKKRNRNEQRRNISGKSKKDADVQNVIETSNKVVKPFDHVIKDEFIESSLNEVIDTVTVDKQHYKGDKCSEYLERKGAEVFDENSLTCTVCDLTFDNSLSLLRHLFIIVKKDDDMTTSVHENLIMKYLTFLSRQSPFQCDVCQFYFNSLTDFASHFGSNDHITRTNGVSTEIKCVQCDLRFHTFNDFERYTVDSGHTGGRVVTLDQVVEAKTKGSDNVIKNYLVNDSKNRYSDKGNYTNDIDVINEHSAVLATEARLGVDMQVNNNVMNEFETNIKEDPDGNLAILMNGIEACSDASVKYDADEPNVKYSDDYTGGSRTQNIADVKIDVRGIRENKRKNKISECKHCAYVSDNASDMKYHYLSEHAKLTFKCDICDIVFLSSGTFRRHSNSKGHQANIVKQNLSDTSEELFQCHVCNKKFTSENYCKFHTALQHFHFKSEDCLLKHPSITRDKYADFLATIAKEPSNAKCKCPDCGLVVMKSSMVAHLRLHTGEQPFECKLCNERFVNLSSLRRHLGVHFDLFSKSCEICGEQFQRLEHYTNHLSLHKAQVVESKTHVCEICGASFYLVKQLRAHLHKHQEKTLKCDFPGCQWTFHNKHDLKMHKLTHSSDEKAFICATCGFTAKCRKYLKSHEKIHAKDVELLECQFCDYKCRKTTHMRRHLRIHFGSKPYKCPYCSYACNTHDNIRKHILETTLHEGMKVYPCKFCEYSTNSTKEFRAHLVRDHSDHVGDGAGFKSLSSFTGLFVESEDLSMPGEGMEIIPVNKRKNSRRSFQPVGEEPVSMYEYSV
ncbi:GDNF-inducible zinc finger protein 1 [Mactra antiquata]